METQSQTHQPFTKAEWLQQLDEADGDIPNLLTWTGTALQSLGAPEQQQQPTSTQGNGLNGAQPPPQPPGTANHGERTEAFKEAMDQFLAVLRSIDVRLKRQIMGLEEAGIITLKDPSATKPPGAAAGGASGGQSQGAGAGAPAASIEPNGVGAIGSLDVGWLNSRSNKVERDMEAEIWTRARVHLETVASGAGVPGARDDDKMEE